MVTASTAIAILILSILGDVFGFVGKPLKLVDFTKLMFSSDKTQPVSLLVTPFEATPD